MPWTIHVDKADRSRVMGRRSGAGREAGFGLPFSPIPSYTSPTGLPTLPYCVCCTIHGREGHFTGVNCDRPTDRPTSRPGGQAKKEHSAQQSEAEQQRTAAGQYAASGERRAGVARRPVEPHPSTPRHRSVVIGRTSERAPTFVLCRAKCRFGSRTLVYAAAPEGS